MISCGVIDYFSDKMEVKALDIDGVHTVRMFEDDRENWFCVADLCECLGTKTKPFRVTAKIEEENKRTEIVENKEYLFVSEKSAYDIVNRSRGKNSKEMKVHLFKFIQGTKPVKLAKKKKIQPDEEENEVVEEPCLVAKEVDRFIQSTRPASPVNSSTTDEKTLVPLAFISKCQPDVARMYFETERYKAELESQTKNKQIEAQLEKERLRNIENNLKQWQFCNKKIMKYGTPLEKEQFLMRAKALGEKLMVDYLPMKNY